MRSDAEIRNDVVDELRWDPQIPEPDAIGVAVTDGAVTLTGHVATYAQKLAAVRAAEEDALGGQAEVDARQIRVEVSGRTAKLYGHVRSMREASAAKAAAAAAPGVASVENHLVVTP